MISLNTMVYELEEGLKVATDGPVVINGVLHRVSSRFVACNPSLNHRAWNVTTFSSACPTCYPAAKVCRVPEYIQGDLFGDRA